MKAAWDWHLPRQTPAEQRELTEFVHDVGFDTLIVPDPTETLVRRAHELNVRVLGVVSPNATAEFRDRHPECLQQMLPVEEEMANAVARAASDAYQEYSFRWFPTFQPSPLVCLEHEPSMEMLKDRIQHLLQLADGIALDGFGFRNHYGCFCGRCEKLHGGGGRPSVELLHEVSEQTLVTTSDALYEHAKTVKPKALVINHVWPDFRPNPYYGCRLRLDYCSQTISWFYRPIWSLERVEFEAREHKRLEDQNRNTFVPFIGLYDKPAQLRPAVRIREELAIARRHGGGHVVFSTLAAVKAHDAVGHAVRDALAQD